MNSYDRSTRGFRPAPAPERALPDFAYARRKLAKCQHLYLAQAGQCGLGVFAARPFRSGEAIMIDLDGDYYDHVFSYRELQEIGLGLGHTLQVGVDAFKLPTGSIDDFTNHSCAPNSGIRLFPEGTVVLAIADIGMHDQITYDYSTYINNPYERMPCHCGAAHCRGVIGRFADLPADLRRRYLQLGIVGDFAIEHRCEEEPSF